MGFPSLLPGFPNKNINQSIKKSINRYHRIFERRRSGDDEGLGSRLPLNQPRTRPHLAPQLSHWIARTGTVRVLATQYNKETGGAGFQSTT